MKIAIADDHQLILSGFSKLISAELPDFKLFTAENKFELLDLLEKNNIDILFQDVKFGQHDAREFIKTIKNAHPKLKIIAISTLTDEQTVNTLLKQGVEGYIAKSDDPDEIIHAIQAVKEGKTFISKDIQQQHSAHYSTKKPGLSLTNREKEVLSAIIDGKTIKECAEQLFLSEKTIETYRSNLFIKFEVNNVASLVKKAILGGFL